MTHGVIERLKATEPELIAIRRDIHRHPETAFEEVRTASIVAEDFAFMLEKKPGAYIMIGNGGDEAGGCHYVHTPLHDFNDEIIVTGAAYWLNVVQQEPGAAAG